MPSVARAARLFFTTSTWMFFSRKLRPQPSVRVGVQTDHVHQQGVVDALQPVAECSATRFLTYLLMATDVCASWALRLLRCGDQAPNAPSDRDISCLCYAAPARSGSSWRSRTMPLTYCPRTAAGFMPIT